MRITVLLALLPTIASFVVHSQTSSSETKLSVLHQDHVPPEEVRAERSKSIRDKLLGEEEKSSKKSSSSSKDHRHHKKEEDTHPHLMEMIHVLEEHIIHEELVDPNA
eukprot:scaffold108_cov162-Amphora_coffeaeformis.AAC.18